MKAFSKKLGVFRQRAKIKKIIVSPFIRVNVSDMYSSKFNFDTRFCLVFKIMHILYLTVKCVEAARL